MRNPKGFSLLELLIVAGIFMVVLIPVLTVFTSSYESYLVQDDISATQQNVRSAMMYLRRDIRMAGAGLDDEFFTFDFYNELGGGFGEPITVYGISAGNGVTPNDYESDELTIRYVNVDENLCGEPGEANLCSDLPPLVLHDDLMPEPSPEARISKETDLDTELYAGWAEDCKCGDDVWPEKMRPALITSRDGSKSEVILITQVQPGAGNPDDQGGKIQNRKVNKFEFRDYDAFTVDNKAVNGYDSGSTISFFNIDAYQRVRYFLHPDNPTVLMREVNGTNAQPLAEGIEDLQFDFLGDFNQDGEQEWYNENHNFAADGNFMDEEDQTRVRMVRIRMIARTSKEWRELGESDKPVLDEFTGADAVSDHFRRRVIVQDVQTRNIGLE
jgi:type II secretory pathway pseudopilin PulG